MSLSKLKKKRSAALEKLVKVAESSNTNKSFADDRFWNPTLDKDGNGYAVIRFLPAGNEEDIPWVKFWDHGFKGPTGKWYIEKSLTSIGQDDPVSEMNSALWNTGLESNKEIVRDRKRRLHYVSNIYIVSDPKNPETEGKVYLYKYGKKIYDKIADLMQPQFEDEDPINPFDLWEGANFKLKIRQVEGYRNYDKSEFDKKSALADDEKLEAIYAKAFGLAEFIDAKSYKSYDELKKKLDFVLGRSPSATVDNSAKEPEPEREDVGSVKSEPKIKSAPEPTASADDDGDDDNMAFFTKLANGE